VVIWYIESCHHKEGLQQLNKQFGEISPDLHVSLIWNLNHYYYQCYETIFHNSICASSDYSLKSRERFFIKGLLFYVCDMIFC